MSKFIEATTICINYSDYFAHCIESNKKSIDRWIVVTEAWDVDTIRLCEKNGLEVVFSERKTANGGAFNRGCLVNDGLALMKKDGWILILDSDIVLPPDFKDKITDADCGFLCGVRRAIYPTFEDWENRTPERVEGHLYGYGYLQLFHGPTWPDKKYAEDCPDAGTSDNIFRNKTGWPIKCLDVTAAHLGPAFTNWSGRVSPTFEKPKLVRELSAEEAAIVGSYNGTHQDWAGVLILKNNGLFSKADTTGGKWSLADGALLLEWNQWEHESLSPTKPGYFSGPKLSLERISQNIAFCCTVCSEPPGQLDWFLRNLRAAYPDAPVYVISDGNKDKAYKVISENYKAKYFLGKENLRSASHGGKWWNRLFEVVAASLVDCVIKIDPDAKVLRKFYYFPEQDTFGTMNGGVIQGGIQGIRRSAFSKFLSSGIFLNEKLQDTSSWATSPEWKKYADRGVISTDAILTYAIRSLKLSSADWDEVDSLWSEPPFFKDGAAAVHPIKEWDGRSLSSNERKVVGAYVGVHKDWSDILVLKDDGFFKKPHSTGGKWALDEGVLTLSWKDWQPEKLAATHCGFVGEKISLLRFDEHVSDRKALAKKLCPARRCAEVGVFRGDYSKTIIHANPSSLVLVDPWKHQESYPDGDLANIDDVEFEKLYVEVKRLESPTVAVMRMSSRDAAASTEDESLNFVYIDARHDKESVLDDILAWWPKIAPGGWLCGHDCAGRWGVEVQAAISDFLATQGKTKVDLATLEFDASWGVCKPGTANEVSDQKKAVVGKYFGHHRDWTDTVVVKANGRFSKSDIGGTWNLLDDGGIRLAWDDYPPESLASAEGYFVGNRNFTLFKQKQASDDKPEIVVNALHGSLGDKLCALAATREYAKLHQDKRVLFSSIPDVVKAYGDDVVGLGHGNGINIYPDTSRREKLNYLGLFLAALGMNVESKPRLDLPSVKHPEGLEGGYLAFQPYSIYAKNPEKDFIQAMIDEARKKYRVIAVGSSSTPMDLDHVDYSFLSDSPVQMLGLIRHAAMVLSPRSASAHMAAGYMVKSFIWVPSDDQNWHLDYAFWNARKVRIQDGAKRARAELVEFLGG